MTATQLKPQPTVPGTYRPKGMLIGGKWVGSDSGQRIAVENPAKRTGIAEVPRAGAADVEAAVAAAERAFPAWKNMVPRERGKLLLKIAEAIEARVEELARTIALETGNALRTQARGEAKLTADIFRYFGGLASELKGETVPLGEHVLSYTRREPIGIVGAIIPWNAPVLLGALKIAPALCAGNVMVMKAAEDAPLGVLMVAEICQEFVPAGVLNVLTGFRVPGNAVPGSTRMRVTMRYDSPPSPCGAYPRGETEDYTVNIVSQQLMSSSITQNAVTAQNEIVDLSLSPNPAKTYINLNLKGWSGVTSICIYDISGKLVQSKQVINANQSKLDISSLKSGMYMLRVFDKADHLRSMKFIKE